MSRILKRPMFRRGGKVNEGIMSGLVDRTKLANGTDIGNMTEDQFRANLKNLMSIQDQFTPLPKTRIPLGEIGYALASGAPVTDALFTGYKKFVSDDDKIRALKDKRKSAAVSTVLGQAFKDKKQKDTRTNEMKMLEEVYGKDSPQYKKALEAIVLKGVLPKSGFRLLSGDEIKQLIERGVNLDPNKPYQINTDQTSKDFNKISVVGGSGMTIQNILGDQKAAKQESGQLTSEAAINKAISNVSFVSEIGKNIAIVDKMLKENPTIGGTSGAVLRFGNKAVSAAKNFGMGEYAEGFLEKFGAKDLVLDDDIATLNALEDAIAPAYARILFPDAKTITNKMIDIARENIGLTTGFTGADEVRGRLAEISRQFDNYIKNQNILIKGPEEKVGDFTKGEDGIYRLK